MANTEHEHAGNADQLRQLQNVPSARCNLCHYALGAELPNGTSIILQSITLPDKRQVLFCDFCTKLATVDETTLASAAGMMRALTPVDEAENQKLLHPPTLEDADPFRKFTS